MSDISRNPGCANNFDQQNFDQIRPGGSIDANRNAGIEQSNPMERGSGGCPVGAVRQEQNTLNNTGVVSSEMQQLRDALSEFVSTLQQVIQGMKFRS